MPGASPRSREPQRMLRVAVGVGSMHAQGVASPTRATAAPASQAAVLRLPFTLDESFSPAR